MILLVNFSLTEMYKGEQCCLMDGSSVMSGEQVIPQPKLTAVLIGCLGMFWWYGKQRGRLNMD